MVLAALASMAPATAGEVTALPGAAPWQGLPDGGTVVGPPERQAGWPISSGFEFVPGGGNGDQHSGGLFFRTSEGLRIGARGSINPGSGNMSAIFALRLEFCPIERFPVA